MCDETSEATNDEARQRCQTRSLSLVDLPVEVFLHICSFLDASTLVHNLGLVCKQFYQILSDNALWKVRISQIWPNTGYPVLPPAEEDDLFWKLSCVAIEKQTSYWRNKNLVQKLSLSYVQCSTIDGLLLTHNGNICISGSRDRSLVCWQLPTDDSDCVKSDCFDFAHNGWIWDLIEMRNTVYSCSWDQTIKAWTLTNTGLVHLKTYDMLVSGALLCMASCADLHLFATGSFCKTVLVFDAREDCRPIARYKAHHSAVISLTMNSHFILSASEDRTVSIWDQRAGRMMKRITISKESLPMSITMDRDMVYVGDSNAKLHVLDPKRCFEPVKCYTTDHKKGITGVHLASGCLITSSMDETVRISSPTDPPQHLTTLSCVYGVAAGIDYLNEVLAVSGTGGIEIWRPKTRMKFS